MELRTLKYFLTVAEELNITRAAEKLNMSQPPLSTQMKALEEELGTCLFVRGKRHLQLTDAGRLLYRRAKEIVELTDKTGAEIISMNEGVAGWLSLGLAEGRAPFLIAEWTRGFLEEYPAARCRLWNGNSDDVLERLEKGLIDLAVIAAPYDQVTLNSISVGREPWVAVMSAEHPLAKESETTIPLRSLVGKPLIVPSRKSRIDAIYKWFRELREEPLIVCESSGYFEAAALAEQNIGIAIFPRTTDGVNKKLASRVITESERQVEYLLVWKKGRPLPTVEEAFIDYVRDWAEETRRHPPEASGYLPSADTRYL